MNDFTIKDTVALMAILTFEEETDAIMKNLKKIISSIQSQLDKLGLDGEEKETEDAMLSCIKNLYYLHKDKIKKPCMEVDRELEIEELFKNVRDLSKTGFQTRLIRALKWEKITHIYMLSELNTDRLYKIPNVSVKGIAFVKFRAEMFGVNIPYGRINTSAIQREIERLDSLNHE